MNRYSFLLTLMLSCGAVYAGEVAQDALDDAPEPPRLPDPVESGTAMELEPQVTIIQKKDTTIEEYRLNGRLYMAKVTPAVGPSYYLVDRDGDGDFESRVNDIYEDMPVPQWVLLSW